MQGMDYLSLVHRLVLSRPTVVKNLFVLRYLDASALIAHLIPRPV